MQVCKHYCQDFEGFTKKSGLYYRDNIVFCEICGVGFTYHGLKCNCCGNKVRTKKRKAPNSKKYDNLVN